MSSLIGRSIGRYHILEQLGEGGMAVVYKALDMQLEREVAVKVILPHRQQAEKFLKRFEREAKMLARLSHPNIVKILDFGTQDGISYLVMEYIRGETLKAALRKDFSWEEAFRIVAAIARAMEAAHRQKVIHRDIKPSNILMDENRQVYISDFGVARLAEGEETSDLTGTGIGVGTPEYMSPEQVMGHVVDGRSDIYALGIVLYQLVTGRTPFRADTPMAVGFKQVSEPLPRPKSPSGTLPPFVERVLIKALAKKPEDRYQNMGELADTLEGLLIKSAAPGQLVTKEKEPFRPQAIHRWLLITLPVAGILSIAAWFTLSWLNVVHSDSSIPTTPAALSVTAGSSTPTRIPQSASTPEQLHGPATIAPVTSTLDTIDTAWSFSEETDDSSFAPGLDLREGSAQLSGNTLDVFLRVADIPEKMTVAHSQTPNDSMEYAWLVSMDNNGDGREDFEAGVFFFKFAGQQDLEVNTAELGGWAQIHFYQFDPVEERWNVGEGAITAEMDPDENIIHIRVVSDQLASNSALTAETRSPEGEDTVRFVESEAPGTSADRINSDFWNVEVQQASSSELIVNFEYQVGSGIDLADLWIGATPVGCETMVSFQPATPGSAVGKFSDQNGVIIEMEHQGSCKTDKLGLFFFSQENNSTDYYYEAIDIPVSLEK